jgi:PAS domain S-box-containing protein
MFANLRTGTKFFVLSGAFILSIAVATYGLIAGANIIATSVLSAALTVLGIVLLVMTHRTIVRPLQRLEQFAGRVRESKDYGLRFEHANQDEIGRVAGAFNGMLAELAASHERDVARQVRAAEDALGLLVGVTEAASSAPTAAALAQACLEQICRSCEWHFGQVWYPDEQDAALHCSAESFFGEPKHARLRALSLRTMLMRGQGLPGLAWLNKRAVWISSKVEDEASLPRLQAARDVGIKAAFAFPVMLEDKVLAVFEFLSDHTRAPERAFLDTVEKLGRILGDSLVRKRSEAALRASEERWRSVFENTTFGIALIDPDSLRYLTTNAAFRAMLGYSAPELRELTPVDISLAEDDEPLARAALGTSGRQARKLRHRQTIPAQGRLLDVGGSLCVPHSRRGFQAIPVPRVGRHFRAQAGGGPAANDAGRTRARAALDHDGRNHRLDRP